MAVQPMFLHAFLTDFQKKEDINSSKSISFSTISDYLNTHKPIWKILSNDIRHRWSHGDHLMMGSWRNQGNSLNFISTPTRIFFCKDSCVCFRHNLIQVHSWQYAQLKSKLLWNIKTSTYSVEKQPFQVYPSLKILKYINF